MKRFVVLMLLGGLQFSSVSSVAWASSSSKIETIGVRSFDQVFSEARDVDNTLISAQQSRQSGRRDLNEVLGLDAKTSFEDALRELRSLGEGKLKVVNRGNVPSLQASEAVPSNVQNAIDTVNSTVSEYQSLLTSLADIPEQCSEISQQASQLSVADLRSETQIRSISDISERIQQARQLRDNVEVVRKLPQKSQRLMSNLRGDVAAVSSVFPSR